MRAITRWLRALDPAARRRAAGNAARDAGDWPTAARRYRDYLDLRPDDAALWVQYGHAVKEGGALDRAEHAYREAMRLNPDDPDGPLQLAHLFKTSGLPHEAGPLFLELYRRDRTMRNLREVELTGLGFQVRPSFETRPDGLAPDGLFVEIRDLLDYLAAHATLTGIPRVTLALVRHVVHARADAPLPDVHFVETHGDGEGLLLLGRDAIGRIVDAVRDEAGPATLRALIEEARGAAPVFRLSAGDTYLIPGAFWGYVANPSWIGGMRDRGVRIGLFLHDLIPIFHADYCVPDWAQVFAVAFADICRMVDFALTNSHHVADDLRRYLALHAVRPFPIVPVPLAHDLGRGAGRAAGRHFVETPFVLYVSTIEPRKNHRYLVAIWQRMLAAGMAVPDLVFVGRIGWRVDDLIAELEASGFLGGRVHILDGLSDADLDDLYARCLFTAFPSFVEGWGLPVGESLAHGKLCVASSVSAIPEVGGDLAVYVDPDDVETGYAVIAGLIRDPGRIAEIERRIVAGFRPRTWRDVGREVFAAVDRLVAATPARRDAFSPRIAAQALIDVTTMGADAATDPDYAANPYRLILADGWHAPDATGAWMLDAQARLRLATDCAPGRAVAILLHLTTSPWVDASNVLTISAGAGACRQPLHADATLRPSIEGRIDEAGVLTIDLAVSGAITTSGGETLPTALRIRSLRYAPIATGATG